MTAEAVSVPARDTLSRRVPPRAVIGVSIARALALGGLTALAQAAVVYRQHYLNDGFAWMSRDMFWMASLANGIILGAVAVAVWLLGRVAPRFVGQGTVDGTLATLATLAVLLMVGGLHEAAVVGLALGVGVQFGRISAAGSPVPRVVTIAGLGFAGLLLAGGLVERATRDGRYAVAPESAPPAGGPNVLVIIWDTVRAASTSLYGAERKTTPELERLAGTSTTFDWAMAPSPWTLPSHCSMFTGLHPGEHSCRWDDPLRGAPTTVAEEFSRRGWRTGAFVANHFYTTHETGLERGFARFEDFQLTFKQLLLASPLAQSAIGRSLIRGRTMSERLRPLRQLRLRGDPKPYNDRKLAATVTDDFLAWHDESHTAPFFAFLNLFDAHDPYEPPSPWDRKFSPTPDRVALYEGGIAYMDDELGRLTRELERRGILDNTVIVVTSDHGEAFGEHGLNNHGHALYMPLIHVPLLVRAPGRLPGGVRVASTVGLRDLAATLLDLAGIGEVQGIAGSSLVATATQPQDSAARTARVALAETERSKLFWSKGPARDGAMHSLIDDRLHYIVDAKGREEIYAYRTDRGENLNLASSDSALASRFRALLPRVATKLVQ